MPEPGGRKIFDAASVQSNGFYRDGVLERGICSGITAYWIRGCFDFGVVTSLSQLGSPMKWTMAQAAYEFGQLKGSTEEEGEQALLDAVGLREVQRQSFNIATRTQRLLMANAMLATDSSTPTCWFIGLARQGGGHTVAAHVVPGGHVVFFDANYGAYEISLGSWPGDFEYVLSTIYRGRYDQPSPLVEVVLD
jgi:hypothetical protein